MADVEHNETAEGGEEPEQTPDKNEGDVAETTDLANEDAPGDDEPKDDEANDTAEAGEHAGADELEKGADDDEGAKPEESADAAEEVAQPEGGDEKGEGGEVEAGADGTEEADEQPEEDDGKNDEPAANDAGEPEDSADKKVDDVVEVEPEETSPRVPTPADKDDKEETTEEVDEEKTANVQTPKELSEETKQRIQQIFERQAANGRLDLKGFKLIFRLMGQVVSSTEAEQMYEDGDRDDNGTIDLDEFLKLYAKYSQEEEERKAALRESIDKLFPDENLRLKKVEQLLMNVNSTIIREKSDLGTNDIRLLVKSMDTDGNGIISKQELVDTLCKHYEV